MAWVIKDTYDNINQFVLDIDPDGIKYTKSKEEAFSFFLAKDAKTWVEWRRGCWSDFFKLEQA